MRVDLVPAGADELEPYRREMLKADLTLAPSTDLYRIVHEGVTVGFCGILWFARKARFKTDFVLPEHRGRGFYRAAMTARLAMVYNRGIRRVEACATDMSLPAFVAAGFEVGDQNSKCTHVHKVMG